MTDSFWAGGGEAYEKAIRVHYQLQIKKLELQLTYCGGEQERLELQEQLKSVEAEYQEKRRASGRLIF